MAMKLRGMQPNMRYLWLSKRSVMGEYLAAFPMYRNLFYRLQLEYNHFIRKIYDAYVKFYILKMRTEAIPKKYFLHAAKLHHNVYLPSLVRGQKQKIEFDTVIAYLNNMSPGKMIYYLTMPISGPESIPKQENSVVVETNDL
jgi:hypothetical protein